MRKPVYSGSNRSGVCVCGHAWGAHHLGLIINPKYIDTTGGPEYHIPQECEFFGFNESRGIDKNG